MQPLHCSAPNSQFATNTPRAPSVRGWRAWNDRPGTYICTRVRHILHAIDTETRISISPGIDDFLQRKSASGTAWAYGRRRGRVGLSCTCPARHHTIQHFLSNTRTCIGVFESGTEVCICGVQNYRVDHCLPRTRRCVHSQRSRAMSKSPPNWIRPSRRLGVPARKSGCSATFRLPTTGSHLGRALAQTHPCNHAHSSCFPRSEKPKCTQVSLERFATLTQMVPASNTPVPQLDLNKIGMGGGPTAVPMTGGLLATRIPNGPVTSITHRLARIYSSNDWLSIHRFTRLFVLLCRVKSISADCRIASTKMTCVLSWRRSVPSKRSASCGMQAWPPPRYARTADLTALSMCEWFSWLVRLAYGIAQATTDLAGLGFLRVPRCQYHVNRVPGMHALDSFLTTPTHIPHTRSYHRLICLLRMCLLCAFAYLCRHWMAPP